MKPMPAEKPMSPANPSMKGDMMMSQQGTRRIVIGGAIVIGLGILWYLFRPELLFVDQKVNEALPTASAPNTTTDGGGESMTLGTGMFHNGAHETKGSATVLKLANGKRVLRLTDFETSNGPDVHVYLVAAADATDDATVKSAGFVDLGSMKGNIGDQNYEIPDDVDLAKHKAVTIWCARFGVNFGTAPLMSGMSSSAGTEPVAVTKGTFHDGAHETKGMATIYRLADGKRVLRLTDFETSNGPDVHVYLVAANDATSDETVKTAGFVDLGSMKGNIGDQNYDIPDEVDLTKNKAVTIWCARFGVNFGTAPLK